MALEIVLAAGEIPQEVPEVHPSHLVIHEKPQVLPHGRFEISLNTIEHPLVLANRPDVFSRSGAVRFSGCHPNLCFQLIALTFQLRHIAFATRQSRFQIVYKVLGQRLNHARSIEWCP